MERPLVVGVDGSDSSLDALDWAVQEAARHGVPVMLVYASLWERYEGRAASFTTVRPSERALAEHIVATAAERARVREPEVKVFTEIATEDAADALIHHSGAGAWAVVVGSRGRGRLAGMLLGSVGLAVAGRAQSPVVVVRGSGESREGRLRRIVLGVSGHAPASRAAAAFALREAEVRGVELVAVHAWRVGADVGRFHREGDLGEAWELGERHAREALDRALSGAARAHPAVPLHVETPEANPRDVLLERAATADLLVLGARRRQAVLGLQLGPVSHAALHHAPCPVAMVPEQ